jgi:acyl carrier protein
MPFFDKFKKKEEITPERRQELLAKIIPVFEKTLEIGKDKIKPESKIIEDLGADSLDTVELVMELEEVFNIEIPDEDAEKMITIEDVIIYLDKIPGKGQSK